MVTSIDYCKALEEINKLVCVQTNEDGWIIDPVTGYIYDPVTGLPHDPVTGLPIDLTGGGNGSGTGGGNNNQPFLDCYNKFLSFIDYYQDKENKPEEYDILVMYLSCLNGDCSTCLTLPYTKLEGRECFVDFCDLTVPDLPEEEEEEEVEIPDFPEIDLGTGVDDTWDDEEPEPTELESDPFVQRGPVWWYHSDHLGSTSYITDILGMPCQYIEYLPFGEVMVQQSTNNIFENVYKFNAKELDESTGYYYYGARYYDPAISIFLSVDPLAEQFPAWNPYHYVHNNPINLIDPTGMEAETDYTLNKKTGDVKQIGETNNKLDRILKTNSKGEVRTNKDGSPKVAIDNIDKGILSDGLNFKNDSNVVRVGDGQATQEGVESFVLNLSEYVRREIGGAYFSNDETKETTHITIGGYINNTYTKNKSKGTSAIGRLSSTMEEFKKFKMKGMFHTHPNEPNKFFPSGQDLKSRNNALKSDSKLNFYILTHPDGRGKKPHIVNYTNY
jgi:RHS repeat-associated protein